MDIVNSAQNLFLYDYYAFNVIWYNGREQNNITTQYDLFKATNSKPSNHI